MVYLFGGNITWQVEEELKYDIICERQYRDIVLAEGDRSSWTLFEDCAISYNRIYTADNNSGGFKWHLLR